MGNGIPGQIPPRRQPSSAVQSPLSSQAPSEVSGSEALASGAGSAASGAASRSALPQDTTRFTESGRIPPDAQNPDLKLRKQLDGKKDKFLADLRKPKADAMKLPSMGPRAEPSPPGLGHDIEETLQRLDVGPRPLTQKLVGASPQAVGGLFAQASPEKLASCLNEMGSASEAQRRELIPKFFDAMAQAQPPVKLSREVLSRLDESALRGLATHAGDNSPGAGAMVSSGLLGELVQRAEGNPKNAMAAMEGLSRLSPTAMPTAMKELGLTQEKLTGWIGEASGTDPMSAKGGWASPETVQRLAGKIAIQPEGRGLGIATALVSTTLAREAERGVQSDEGLQGSLERLLERAQGADVPPSERAAVAHSVMSSGSFQQPRILTEKTRLEFTRLVASAPQEFLDVYRKDDAGEIDTDKEQRELKSMIRVMGFTGPETTKEAFNTMWGNLIGSTLNQGTIEIGKAKEAEQQLSKLRREGKLDEITEQDLQERIDSHRQRGHMLAGNAGQVFQAHMLASRDAGISYKENVKFVQDLMAGAYSGLVGGFSWRCELRPEQLVDGKKVPKLDYNLLSLTKDLTKEFSKPQLKSPAEFMLSLFGVENPNSEQVSKALYVRLQNQSQELAKEVGLTPDDWRTHLNLYLGEGASPKVLAP